jgi:hypothetical protein
MFRQALCQWLAGHGLSEEECDQVCKDRRVALSLQLNDAGGMLQDVGDALMRVGEGKGREAARALYEPAEQLLLMFHLNGANAKNKKSPKAAEKLSEKAALLQRICRQLELTGSEYRILATALA